MPGYKRDYIFTKIWNITALFLLSTVLLLTVPSCRGGQKSDTGDYFKKSGDAHRTNQPAAEHKKEYQRIVSMSPAITEIIFFLGEQDRLVGVTDHCNYPAQAKKIDSIGGYGNPGIERIVSLRPDLILTTNGKRHPSYAKLMSLKMNVQDIETHSFSDTMKMINELGDILGVPDKARRETDKMTREIDEIRKRYSDVEKPVRVFVEVNYNPIFTIGHGSFISDMLHIIGAENVFDDIEQDYPEVSAEAVIRANPEVIFLGHGSQHDSLLSVRKRPGWDFIDAVRNGRVYGDVHPDLYHRPGPRVVQGLRALEKRIHGE